MLAPVPAPAGLAAPADKGLRARGWRFYVFVGDTGCRFMCAWDTAERDVDRLLADVAALSE